MPNLEWSVSHQLITPYATVDLNALSGYRYLVQADGYRIVPALRVTQENVSQADGSVLNPRYKTGLVATIKVALDIGESENASRPACGADLRLMAEELVGALNSITSLRTSNQRLVWQPTGYGDLRMLTDIQVLQWADPEDDLDGTEMLISFAVETPFPYAIDATQTETDVPDGVPTAVVNAGNAWYSPVVKVFGPTSAFTLTNAADLDDEGNPKSVVYDSSRLGAVAIGPAQYAEIDFFKGAIILNGDIDDLVAGLDPETTDFWRLLPSALSASNMISCVGADCTVFSNNAWA